MNREAVLRSARGYTPTAIQLNKPAPLTLAVGGHLKNTVAIAIDKGAFISQHIGDLETRQAHDTFVETIKSLSDIYDFKPENIVSDMHPDYLSTQYYLEASDNTWREAARIYFELRRSGVTLNSPVDCCIAQIAMEHDALLLHVDKDFERISRMRPLEQERFELS